jgi:hypothetical protein
LTGISAGNAPAGFIPFRAYGRFLCGPERGVRQARVLSGRGRLHTFHGHARKDVSRGTVPDHRRGKALPVASVWLGLACGVEFVRCFRWGLPLTRTVQTSSCTSTTPRGSVAAWRLCWRITRRCAQLVSCYWGAVASKWRARRIIKAVVRATTICRAGTALTSRSTAALCTLTGAGGDNEIANYRSVGKSQQVLSMSNAIVSPRTHRCRRGWRDARAIRAPSVRARTRRFRRTAADPARVQCTPLGFFMEANNTLWIPAGAWISLRR